MNEKKSFNQKLDKFFAGKGFYIVLFLCVAVIGVSTYFMLTNRGTDVENNLTAPQNSTELNELPLETAEAPVVEQHGEEVPGSSEDGEETETSGEVDVWNEQEAEAAVAAQFVWPLEGRIELPFSVTTLIYNQKLGDWRTHDGVDIAAPLGTQVCAIASGVVENVYNDGMGGMTVVIEHAGGLRSIYSNLAAVPTVYAGDSVMTGEVIGAVGTTAPGESAENPRLCLKMTLDGISVNPADYLPPR